MFRIVSIARICSRHG